MAALVVMELYFLFFCTEQAASDAASVLAERPEKPTYANMHCLYFKK